MGGDGGYLPCDSSALMGQPTGVSRSAYSYLVNNTAPDLQPQRDTSQKVTFQGCW